MALADLNGDGSVDAVSAEGRGGAADLDGDGRLDLVVPAGSTEAVHLLSSRPGGPLGPVRRYATSNNSSPALDAADVTGDGLPDVIQGTFGDHTVQLMPGRPGGGVEAGEPVGPIGGANESWAVDLVDMDGDSLLDLLTGSSVRLGLPGGGFATTGLRGPQQPPERQATAFLNGDALPDYLQGGSTAMFLEVASGNGGVTSAGGYYTLPATVRAVRAGDVDEDGKVDAVGLLVDGRVALCRGDGAGNLGTGTVVSSLTVPGGATRPDLELADLDGDLHLDPVRLQAYGTADPAVPNGTPDRILVQAGRGDGTFGTAQELRCGRSPVSVQAGDLDGDGRADLVAGNILGASVTVRLSGNGTPSWFEAPHSLITNRLRVRLRDANGDGRLDVLVGGDSDFALLPGR